MQVTLGGVLLKIGLLGPANSIHLIRIANALVKNGLEVLILSLPNHRKKNDEVNAEVVYLKYSNTKGYYLNFKQVRKLLKEKEIDVLNVHYASGYGTLGRFVNFHPMILSVWGSDIFSFPKENIIKKKVIIRNLLAADEIFATSNCIAEEIRKYIELRKKIVITPFGVDTNLFKPQNTPRTGEIVIGFLKGTNPIYGIDIFIKAFKILSDWSKGQDFHLKGIVCGNQSHYEKIRMQIKDFNLSSEIKFLGEVQHNEMPKIINGCDLVCIPSREESFGVVAIEALACGVPCVTSDAPGLKEIMEQGMASYSMPCDEKLIAVAMQKLILNQEERVRLGSNGRKLVEKLYDFEQNIRVFSDEFEQLLYEAD